MRFRAKERGEIALLIAAGILVFTVIFSFWRVHEDEKSFKDEPGTQVVKNWDDCLHECAEAK